MEVFCFPQRIPIWFKIVEHDAEKFPESAWKSIIYTITWTWAVYLCVFSEDKYFFYPMNTWRSKRLETYMEYVHVHVHVFVIYRL